MRSASTAASSASGESGIVSKLEILGLRDRVDVGVEGTDDEDSPLRLLYDGADRSISDGR